MGVSWYQRKIEFLLQLSCSVVPFRSLLNGGGNTVKSRFFLPLLSPLCGIHLSHLPLFSVFKYCTQPEDVNKVPKLGRRNKQEVWDGKENSEKGKEKKREFRRLTLLPSLSFPPTAGGYILPLFFTAKFWVFECFGVFFDNSTRIVFTSSHFLTMFAPQILKLHNMTCSPIILLLFWSKVTKVTKSVAL